MIKNAIVCWTTGTSSSGLQGAHQFARKAEGGRHDRLSRDDRLASREQARRVRHLRRTPPEHRQPQVSKHLKVLAGAELVAAEADGRHRRYHLDGRGLRAAHGWFTSFEDVWEARFDALDALVTTDVTSDADVDPQEIP